MKLHRHEEARHEQPSYFKLRGSDESAEENPGITERLRSAARWNTTTKLGLENGLANFSGGQRLWAAAAALYICVLIVVMNRSASASVHIAVPGHSLVLC